MPNGKYIFKPKRVLEDSYKLIIVDEVSMLPKSLWDLLLSHKIHIIACGDPEQLPPVDKNDTHNVLNKPHIFLDEIMRQAAESEIIQTSMKIRAGETLRKFDGQEVKIYRPYQLTPAMYQWADQILCATNQTRNKINHIVRKMSGKPIEPIAGDKVIGLRNHWDNISENGNALTNGQIGVLSENFHIEEYTYPPYVTNKKVKVLITDIITDDGDIFYDIPIDYQALTTGEKALTPEEEYRAIKLDLPVPYEFAYGYAITTWKAQGSEWDKVLFFEENFPYAKEEHRKYLYTGITRASKKLVIITK